jgi:hypothetical protein
VTPGTHGDYFPGWQLPPCISATSILGQKIIEQIKAQESDVDVEDTRGRSRVRDDNPSQRRLSLSPPPKAKVGAF